MLFTPQLSVSTTTSTTNITCTTSTTTASTVPTTTTTTTTSDFTWTPTEQPNDFNGIDQDEFCVPYTSTVNSIKTPVMTYHELQSMVNKWNIELDDEERNFLSYASQINAWDLSVMENSEKITVLHEEVEKVKKDQKRLGHELDFILSQQKELEDILIPLEDSLKDQNGSIFLQQVDQITEKTYKAAENIDTQLAHIKENLMNITEHLNYFGTSADTADPLQHICKILSTHMDSLQWIDENSGILQRKVEEVSQILEEHQAMEQSRNARIAFD
ncbi:nucleoporin-62 C-terminal-like protein [Sorex araneus]|uniref:nucleoporin-62 C-terminal-like protein n=1 Tax=Sorex araneus TaxID=42254 RepID=UPI002433AFCF|nr:nucleoporin-62 C-terminal-like protein [Sorex araneus]XP_054978449.1 nucleoporin-62 C-terminal-like protein [Sorex araneus]